MTICQDRAGGMVETKGISQPFTLKGGAEQDFDEWTHKVRTFMLARFGGSDSWCSNLGITSTENRCQSLRTFADRLMSLEKVPTRRTRSTRLTILLESSTHTLCLLEPTQPTGSSETQAKAMAWKPGDYYTVSTTRSRP